jgi:cobalt-precorrin-5B (C1)-methyltransferase
MNALRTGLTTGTCAAAASKAAVLLLSGVDPVEQVEVLLPDGEAVAVAVEAVRSDPGSGCAKVRKDAGDDPDITNGAYVVAEAVWLDGSEITLRAGEGVGNVTLPGLQIPPGEPAINPVPRKMILDAVREVTERGVCLTISIPGGRELAARTFNPRLGIEGGLSILGTTGRVRPFSCDAVRETIRCALDVLVAGGALRVALTPGHIGERAARRHFALGEREVVEVSNEWGSTMCLIAERPFEQVLVVGHPGKLAKLCAGQWDTHSSRSDSALPVVTELAERLLGRVPEESRTVEGLFQGLSVEARARLGNELARLVRLQVGSRLGRKTGTAVVLVDMQGEILGRDGDWTIWKPAE